MEAIAKDVFGVAGVLSDGIAPASTQEPVAVEVWMSYADDHVGTARKIGTGIPSQTLVIDYNPELDAVLRFTPVSLGMGGQRSVGLLSEAKSVPFTMRRETEAPVVGVAGDSTAEQVSMGIGGFTPAARRRLITISPNPDMSDAFEQELVYEGAPPPYFLNLNRQGPLVPDFAFTGVDPTTEGFTLTVDEGSSSDAAPGWRIDCTNPTRRHYYSVNIWPVSPFDDGFTFEVTPPTVDSISAGAPDLCVGVAADDGSQRYELGFDADEVSLNGGSSHALGADKARVVIAPGGATADLWVGETKVETAVSPLASVTSEFSFGDLTTLEGANAVWHSIEAAFSPQPVRLADTIYVTVAHSSGGAYTEPSEILELTFKSEGGAGGSVGTFDPLPRDNIEIILD